MAVKTIAYDFEFLEDGRTIMPISIGMVDGAGNHLYVINKNVAKGRIYAHEWLRKNVLPHMPLALANESLYWNELDERYRFLEPEAIMAQMVREFVNAPLGGAADVVPAVEFWADCGAFDHVVLAWLFGPMQKWPEGWPYYTNDLQQEWARQGSPLWPRQVAENTAPHNALADAQEVMERVKWLKQRRTRAASA